ncbi:MAG: hypothetical protein MUF54_01145, partial [Polyangiaceae bacterium]|nr:hypothetical protein [Polyangiaceae bacterium]
MRTTVSVRRVLGVAVWSCGLAAASCRPAVPQADLASRFFAVHTAMQASGLTQIGPVSRGELRTGQATKQRLELDASCVTIVAIGGPTVQDVALRIRDGEDKEVARDDMQGPDASVRYCADQPGKHELELVMAKGEGAYVVTTWKGGQPSRTLEATGSASATVTGGGSCEVPTVIANGQTYVGDTSEGRAMEEGSCGNTVANELVYRLDLPTRQRVTLEVRAQFDAVLYVRRGECADPESEAACNDDAPGGGRRSRIDEVFDPGTYYVFVDGYGEEEGAFRMMVQMRPASSARAECEAAPLLASTGSARGTLSERVSGTRASCGRNA